MKRLTEHVGGYIQVKGCKTLYSNKERKTAPASNAIVRLAAYEDAMPIERAQELAQAEKDGRLVVLPKGTESMIMAGVVAKGNEMFYPVMETKGDPEFIPAILSFMINAVSAANGISYNMFLSALIDNPLVTTCKQDAGGKAEAGVEINGQQSIFGQIADAQRKGT